MATLIETFLRTVRAKINSGLRSGIKGLIPVKTGALRNSVKISVQQRRGGVSLKVELLDYFIYQRSVGANRELIKAITALMVSVLHTAAIDAVRIHLWQKLGAWDFGTQQTYSRNQANSLAFEVKINLLNFGR